MGLLLLGLLIGLILGMISTKMVNSKMEIVVEEERKEFKELEKEYGEKLNSVYNNLSGDLKQVIERYYYLKSKFDL